MSTPKEAGTVQPLEKHSADLDTLRSCATGLLRNAAVAFEHRDLTLRAYQPAVAHWDGIGGSELASAPLPLRHNADQVYTALAWAGLVAEFWAGQVETFNQEVEKILGRFNQDAPHYGLDPAATEPELAEARDFAFHRATTHWHEAHEVYIRSGEDDVAAMLRDGPNQAGLARLAGAGVIDALRGNLAGTGLFEGGLLVATTRLLGLFTHPNIGPDVPPPPGDPPARGGSGPHGAEQGWWFKRVQITKRRAAYRMADAAEARGHTNAARHLRHYLGNTGEDLHVNPDSTGQWAASEPATAALRPLIMEVSGVSARRHANKLHDRRTARRAGAGSGGGG